MKKIIKDDKFVIRVDDNTRAALDQLAKKTFRSRSDVICQLIKQANDLLKDDVRVIPDRIMKRIIKKLL